jgi:streptogramin lyase
MNGDLLASTPVGLERPDPTTGSTTTLVAVPAGEAFVDLAVELTGTVAALQQVDAAGRTRLVRIDPAAGTIDPIPATIEFGEALAVEPDGAILVASAPAAGQNPQLFRVDPVTGAATLLAAVLPAPPGATTFVRSVVSTPAGSIYVATYSDFESTTQIAEIDVVNGTARILTSVTLVQCIESDAKGRLVVGCSSSEVRRFDPADMSTEFLGFRSEHTALSVTGNDELFIAAGAWLLRYDPVLAEVENLALTMAEPVFALAVAAPIEIDILPGRDPNVINPFRAGRIDVAILGSPSFDVEEVDRSTQRFGPKGAEPATLGQGTVRDVNGDGIADLVTSFATQDTGIAIGDTKACLSFEAVGAVVESCDEIETIPSKKKDCGLGFELGPVAGVLLWLRGRRRRAGSGYRDIPGL